MSEETPEAVVEPFLAGRAIDADRTSKAQWFLDLPSVPAVRGGDVPPAEPEEGDDDPDEPPSPLPAVPIDDPGPLDGPADPPTVVPPPVVVPRGTPPVAAGTRRARPVATTVGEPVWARHNWVPTGPRNVGGRVRALVGHPTEPDTLYAGAAAGGVYRTRDDGETWEALWHEQRSLAIGALAVGLVGAATIVYAATGEPESEDRQYVGDGIHVSRDGGDTWDAAGQPSPPGAAPNLGTRFEALAVHPDDGEVCWAVGAAGIFRTVDGGGTWTQHRAGLAFTDVVYSPALGGAGQRLLYLVPSERNARGAVSIIRVELAPRASVADVNAALGLAANRMQVVRPGTVDVVADRRPARAKLAICADHPEVAYLRVTRADEEHHLGLFRTQQATRVLPEPAGTRWDIVRDHPHWRVAGQASYDLCIAVHPHEAGTVITGMTELHLSVDCDAAAAGAPPTVPANWVRIMAWDHNQQDRGHHADQHAVFWRDDPTHARGALWAANDGGVSRTLDWDPVAPQTLADKEWRALANPTAGDTGIGITDEDNVPGTAAVWRKRGHGIDATMMYSMSQHPAVPGTVAVGLQDNGCWMTTGGHTWASIGGGDGGFVAFAPDDPYALLTTSQEGIDRVSFAGLVDDVLSAQARRPLPGSTRGLALGFLSTDPAAFVADTSHHPRDKGRVFHTRRNRLYATDAAGESFVPLDVGDRLEIRHVRPTGRRATLEVRPSRAASLLGLPPQLHSARVATVSAALDLALQERAVARVVCEQPGPFAFAAGDELVLVVDGVVRRVPIAAHATIPDLARTTATQLAAYLRATQAPLLDARLRFEPPAGAVRISTLATGAAAQLTLAGTAFSVMTRVGTPVPAIGALDRRYAGEPDRPASVTLVPYTRDNTAPSPAGDRTITVTVGGGAAVTARLEAASCADPSEPTTGELAAALRAVLDPATVAVTEMCRTRQVQLTFLVAGAGIRLAGTMLPRLSAFGGTQRLQERLLLPGNGETFDLRPPGPDPLVLRIDDGVGAPIPVRVRAPADVPDLTTVTVEELRRVIAARLRARYGAGTHRVRADLTDRLFPPRAQAVDLHPAPSDPDTIWVGSTSGSVFVSRDSGATWTPPAPDQRRALTVSGRRVGAVAVHPTDPRTVYLGHRDTGARDRTSGTLWRSTDGGATWVRRENGLRDGAGRFVGVNAIEIDPEAPDVVYAATEAGVFRSGDAGGLWEPINDGLPNARIVDLALEPATRTLRVGAWGRGTYARHVGTREPADVRLCLRAHALDSGERPAGRGPDAFADHPAGVGLTASPDLKHAAARPATVGGTDPEIDGVEHDLDVVHEAPRPDSDGVVFVQVGNHGWTVPTGVRVVVLWTEVSDGPPPVPAALWTALAAGPLVGDQGPWHLLTDTTMPDLPASPFANPARPRVLTADFHWPPAIAGTPKLGLLALVGCTQDPLAPAPAPDGDREVLALVQTSRHVAYRETPVRTPRSRLVVEATTDATFDLADDGAGGANGAIARLGVPAPTAGLTRVTLSRTVFNLGPPGGARGLRFTIAERRLDIPFVPGTPSMPDTAAGMATVSIAHVMGVIGNELTRSGLPVEAWSDTWTSVPPVRTPLLHCTNGAGATVAVTAPSAADPQVVALGIAGGFAAERGSAASVPHAPYNLTPVAAGPRLMRLRVRQTRVVPLGGFPALAAVTMDQLRTRLDTEFRRRALPLRVLVGEIALRVRRPGRQGTPYADVVARPAPVPAGPARDRLFEISGPRPSTVGRAAATTLYLRTSNDGDAAQDAGRHRAFAVPLGATPLAVTQIGGDVAARVPERTAVVVEIGWDTSALAVGDVVAVLVVADDPAEVPVAVPAGFADLAALDAFCAARVETGYRLLRAE